MNSNYHNALRDHGQSLITHLGLVNEAGVEVSSGGYSRQAVTWVDDADGVSRPSADLVFTTAAGDQVAAWRGYSALTAGVDYGGANIASGTKNYSNPGTFTLQASQTTITHSTP